MKRIIQCLGMIFLTLSMSVYGLSHQENDDIEMLYKTAGKDPYLLSLPLLISAQLKNDKLYKRIHPSMLSSVNDLSENSYKAWLLGRVLKAANNINDKVTLKKVEIQLYDLLTDKKIDQDAFLAWGWAYYADTGQMPYRQAKTHLMKSVEALDEAYHEKAKKLERSPDPKVIQDLQTQRSNTLWAWVMALKAAATAKDEKTYHIILNKIKLLTQKKDVPAALNTGLLRSSSLNDYPAWALSMVAVAAMNMGDEGLYEKVQPVLAKSLQSAKAANATAEVLLAESLLLQVNSQ